MPTYEYECTVCGHTFEKFQFIKARPVKDCPTCGKKVRRLISAGAGLIFKGSGFYITDYRNKDYRDKKKEDKDKKPDTKKDKPDKKKSDQTAQTPASGSGGDKSTSKQGTKKKGDS